MDRQIDRYTERERDRGRDMDKQSRVMGARREEKTRDRGRGGKREKLRVRGERIDRERQRETVKSSRPSKYWPSMSSKRDFAAGILFLDKDV